MKNNYIKNSVRFILSLIIICIGHQISNAQIPGCHAGFTFTKVGNTVTFTDSSWFDIGPQNTTWTWNFGDGDTCTMQNPPSHIYSNLQQQYIACLTATNCSTIGGLCCTDTYCDTIRLSSVNLLSSDTTFCEKNCIDFFDLSTNSPTSWQWFFPGADSTSSNLQNPSNICYNSYGSFDVTLIACNGTICDTLVLHNFINSYQNPVDSIWISNDTLYSLPAYSYQWYEAASGLISGAVNQIYIPTQQGSYFCVASDSLGCVATSNVIAITGLQVILSDLQLLIQPNPFKHSIVVSVPKPNFKQASLNIYDIIGSTIFQTSNLTLHNDVDLSFLPKGIYLLEVSVDGEKLVKKIIKE